jgi:hypothetical protein
MTAVTRVFVDINAAWNVTFTCPDKPGWRLGPRQMGKVTDEAGRSFPQPPDVLHDPGAGHAGQPVTAADIGAAYDAIAGRRGNVRQFGHYLFDALIGTQSWGEILTLVEGLDISTLELALAWPSDDLDLHRLNWEMLHDDHRFLAAGAGRLHISVTRIVDTPQTQIARQLQSPPRILFVVGTSVVDREIRPGAELASLLLRIQGTGRNIHHRVLQRASPATLKRTMATFRPDVVQFICHGGFDRGRPYLELQTDEADNDPRRYAEQLLSYLNVDGEYPPIVVLSACFTANSVGLQSYLLGPGRMDPEVPSRVRLGGGNEMAPLAAKLIMGGVPVVIGMAGRVADMTCRLFISQFGESIVRGESLVMATAQARQATFAEGRDPVSSADWAFPAVFTARGVCGDYVPLPENGDDDGARVEGWIDALRLRENPVFCGREEFLQAFHDLFQVDGNARPAQQVLAVFVKTQNKGYGRTRLLKELAINALREGNIPVFLTFPPSQAPKTLEALAKGFLGAISQLRWDAFGLAQEEADRLELLQEPVEDALRKLPAGDVLAVTLRQAKQVTARALMLALEYDLGRLLDDVRAQWSFFDRPDARVVVLLDDVDQYGPLAGQVFNEILGPNGLGSRLRAAPVVAAFSLGQPATDPFLLPISEGNSGKPWIRPVELGVFDQGSDLMACQLVLLTPYNDLIYAGVSDKAWAFNDQVEDGVREHWENKFSERLRGLPSRLSDETFYVTADDAGRENFVLEADDEDWLQRVRGGARE